MNTYKQKITKKNIIYILLVIVILINVVPVPYYVEMPGSAESLREHVSVDHKRDKFEGDFMLTTVAVRQATLPRLVSGYINPTNDLISRKEMMGTNSHEEYEEMQKYNMKSSQNFAIKVASDLADKPYEMDYKGVYVMSIEEDSDFYHRLHVGDTIKEVDDTPFDSSQELIDYIQEKEIGEPLSLVIERDGKDKPVSGKIKRIKQTKKKGIGISLVDHTEVSTPSDIYFNTEDIGGPSAGLMFTLELYSLLTGKDLRQGQFIAGTGTIAPDGTVGRIGGIDKKVIAADREGATLFFAPDDTIDPEIKKEHPTVMSNYEEAKASVEANHLDIKVVPVKTAQDAIDYLLNKKT